MSPEHLEMLETDIEAFFRVVCGGRWTTVWREMDDSVEVKRYIFFRPLQNTIKVYA